MIYGGDNFPLIDSTYLWRSKIKWGLRPSPATPSQMSINLTHVYYGPRHTEAMASVFLACYQQIKAQTPMFVFAWGVRAPCGQWSLYTGDQLVLVVRMTTDWPQAEWPALDDP